MKSVRKIYSYLFRIFIVIFIAFVAYSVYYVNSSADPLEVTIFTSTKLAKGKPVNLVVRVRDAKKNILLANAKVKLGLNDDSFGSVETGKDGTALITIDNPPRENFVFSAQVDNRKTFINVKYHNSRRRVPVPKASKKISISTDKTFYVPGDEVKFTVNADLPAGTDITVDTLLGKVLLKQSSRSYYWSYETTYEYRISSFKKFSGKLDAKKELSFQFKLPSEFGKLDFNERDSVCEFKVRLPKKKSEMDELFDDVQKNDGNIVLTKSVPVSIEPVRFQYLPENYPFLPPYENGAYVFVHDPSGEPYRANVTLGSQVKRTDKNGIALFENLTGKNWKYSKDLVAEIDVKGCDKIEREILIEYENPGSEYQLTAGKSIYNAGDTIELEGLSPVSRDRVYINIIHNDCLIKFLTMEFNDNHTSRLKFKIPEHLSGLVMIDSFRLMGSEKIYLNYDIIQINHKGIKPYFSSKSDIVRAVFQPDRYPQFAQLASVKGKIYSGNADNYTRRASTLNTNIDKYKKKFYPALAIVCFIMFFIFLIIQLPMWFVSKNSYIIDKMGLQSLAKRNILWAVVLVFIIFIIDVWVSLIETGTKSFGAVIIYSDIINVIGLLVSAGVILIIIVRSFLFRNKIMKIEVAEGGNIIKNGMFVLPYLLIIYFIYDASVAAGGDFVKKLDWFPLLNSLFNLMVIVWLFCAVRVFSFFYTLDEAKAVTRAGRGYGGGLGANPFSFIKVWVVGGLIYWGLPLIIYWALGSIVLALFLPLVKTMEKLG